MAFACMPAWLSGPDDEDDDEARDPGLTPPPAADGHGTEGEEAGPTPPDATLDDAAGAGTADALDADAPGDDAPSETDDPAGPDPDAPAESPRNLAAWPLGRGRKTRRLEPPEVAAGRRQLTPAQRLLILDAWQRSGLPAGDFAPLVGCSRHTLYLWQKRFKDHGPAGLEDAPRGQRKGSRLPELTKRAILLIKQAQPDAGCERISDLLARGPALPASPGAVARVLTEAGYTLHETPTRPHAPPVRRFERARPNQLWQSDLFTFVLKRQNRRVHLVVFLDDHSRFITGWGLHATAATALVLKALRAGITNYGPQEEVLTDSGPQYVTWRGTSAFARECTQRGIRHLVATPRRPQTLGKTERFWGTLWRECVETGVFVDLADARTRLAHFFDHYNFQRPHQGCEGLVPADRFFHAAPEVRRALEARIAANALALARDGAPKVPFYVAGQTGGRPFSVHAEGERLILIGPDGQRQEVVADPPPAVAAAPPAPEPPPGTSPLDAALRDLAGVFGPGPVSPVPPPAAPTPPAAPPPTSAPDTPADPEVADA